MLFLLTQPFPFVQNVRQLPRIKFNLCSLDRLTAWVINLGPERSSWLLPTVEVIGPGLSQGTVFQSYDARKIRPSVIVSDTNARVFHSLSLLWLLRRHDLITESTLTKYHDLCPRTQADCCSNRGIHQTSFDCKARCQHLEIHVWAPLLLVTVQPL